jgi:hypothetical protein
MYPLCHIYGVLGKGVDRPAAGSPDAGVAALSLMKQVGP